MKLAAILLVLSGVIRHYSWEFVSPELQALAWNAAGSLVTIVLVWVVAQRYWSPIMAVVFAGWGLEEAQVFGCSVGRMVWHWNVAPGQEQCSAPLGLKIGAFTILGVALLLATCKTLQYEADKEAGE